MKRYASILGLRAEHEALYREMHSAVWPAVLATITRCHIHNYSIYLHDGILFAYFEYHGTDFAVDSAVMAADPDTQRWWEIMMPLQRQLDGTPPGEWWLPLEEVFHTD